MTNQTATRLYVTVRQPQFGAPTIYPALTRDEAYAAYQANTGQSADLVYLAELDVPEGVNSASMHRMARILVTEGIHHRDITEYSPVATHRLPESGTPFRSQTVTANQLSVIAETGVEEPYVVFDVLHPQQGDDAPIATAHLTPDEAQQAGLALILAAATARAAL